jgi:hypothetical protein
LINEGFDINKLFQISSEGINGTLLHISIEKYNKDKKRDLIDLLINYGADFKIKDSNGRTPKDLLTEEDFWK